MNTKDILSVREGKEKPKKEGKAKLIFETSDPHVYRMVFKDDITAGDGKKKDTLPNKGKLNQTISKKIFEYLHGCPTGRYDTKVRTHYISSPFVNTQLVKRLEIIPVEVIIRNFAAGSFCRRYGIESGRKFHSPLLELFYKDDDLHDPLVGEDVVLEMEWCTASQLAEIKRQAHIVHARMSEYWKSYELTLVDAKYEFGVTSSGEIVLADEITPDSQRIWDKDGASLDKDTFRTGTDMDKVETVYNYIHDLIHADAIE